MNRQRPCTIPAHLTRIAALLLLISGTASLAPGVVLHGQSVRVNDDHAVQIGLEDSLLVYPHLAVHPANDDHLLGAAWVTHPAPTFEERVARETCVAMLSVDGGQNWQRHDFPLTHCGDPWVAFTADGRATFTVLARHPGTQHESLLVFHSADGGVTWDEHPINLGRAHDHQTVVAAGTPAARSGWLYLISSQEVRGANAVWRASVHVTRSRDGGRRFDPPTYISPNNLFIKAETGVVLSDGTLVVSYVEGTTNAVRYFPLRRAWVVRSTDAGHTFSTPMFVNDACGPMPDNRFTLSTLMADPGPFNERLYFVCNLAGGGGIVLNHSTDGGERWTYPIPVHSAPVDTLVRRRMMGAAVNREGIIGVLWADFRSPGADCYDAYFAASVDGGQTFLPETRVSSAASCPDPTVMGGTVPWRDGGAYWGLATDSAGRFRLLWSDARDGAFRLRTATVTVEVSSAGTRAGGVPPVNVRRTPL